MAPVFFKIFSVVLIAMMVRGPEPGLGDDIGTNFFLKASKSVPRIGRRSMDFDNHFLKASKSVPRIGRRGALNDLGQFQDVKGYPIIRTNEPEVYIGETGHPLWSDFERAYDSLPRFQKLRDEGDGNEPYWTRVKKDLEMEEPKIQPEVF